MTRAQAPGLAFVAGFVDTLGFIALFGLFTAHVTGNFVLIGAALTQAGAGVLYKLLAFPAFIAAVALAHLLALRLVAAGRAALRPLLLLQALLLAGFALVGALGMPLESAGDAAAAWAGMLGAAAMGLQNAQGRFALAKLAPTTVMTGNVTQLVVHVVDHLAGSNGAVPRGRMAELALTTLTFGLGAVAGAFGFLRFGFGALLLPVLLLIVLALSSQRATHAS